MTAIRTPKQDHYTIVSNHYLRDARLSWAAKGFLTYLLSLPQDWSFTFKHFIKTSKNGERSTRTILKELQQAGYLELQKSRNKKGHPITSFFMVYESPQKQCMENPLQNPNCEIHTAKSTLRNAVLQNTKGPNTEKQNKDLSQEKREKRNKREKKESAARVSTDPITPEEQAIYTWAQRDPFWSMYIKDLPSLRKHLLQGTLKEQYSRAQKKTLNASTVVEEALRLSAKFRK